MNEENRIQEPAESQASELEDLDVTPVTEVDEAKVQEMLSEWEPATRQFTGKFKILISVIAVLGSLWSIYSLGFAAFSGDTLRLVHLMFGLILTPLLYPGFSKSKKVTPFDWFLAAVGVVVVVYVLQQGYSFAQRGGFNPNTLDLIIDATAIILILVLTRRVLGWPLVIVSLVFLAYARLGPYFPGLFMNKSFAWKKILGFVYSSEGLFGMTIGTSATYVILFMILGAFLKNSGAGNLYTNFAYSIAGRFRGGPAKVAVVSSALFGTISGSGLANVVTTGSITIPLMKKSGFNPVYAAAVEAVASTGGQIMPPVMGAGAFLIAEFVRISYTEVCVAAALPALLYFITCFFIIDLRAGRDKLHGVSKESLPRMAKVLITEGYLFIPLIVLLYVLLVVKYTAVRAAFMAIFATMLCMVATSVIRIVKKMDTSVKKELLNYIKSVLKSLEDGFMGAMEVICACACAGIIMALVTLTGVGTKLSTIILLISGNSLFLALILTAIVVIVLSMGLPTTACYLVASTIMAPSLGQMGISMLQAHLFIFYFACLSGITPPVALVAYPAAAIAKTDPWKTGIMSFRMAFVGFVIPFIMVYSEAILLIGELPEIISVVITSLIGSYFISVGLEGWYKRDLHMVARGIMILGGIALLIPGWTTDVIGIGLVVLAYLVTKFIFKNYQFKAA